MAGRRGTARRVARAVPPVVARTFLALAATVALGLAVVTVTGCGHSDDWTLAHAARGWSAQYGDAANSSFTPVKGAPALRFEWSRSVKGSLGAQVALGSGDYLAANGQTPAGCSLVVWEADRDGRQRWCSRLWQGGGVSGALFDGFDNLYVGQPGAILSFPPTQWIRWRNPVIGLPMTPRLLAPGKLLVVTHLGQVLVFDAQRGAVQGTSLDLVTGVDPKDSERGLADCAAARAACPVAAAPAFSARSGLVVLGLWEPGAPAPELVGLRYRADGRPMISRAWISRDVGGGPLASPVLSADGSTVYVNGRDGRLWALDAEDGTAKWSVPLGYLAQTPPSVAPGGTVVAGGGPGARLLGIADRGDSADVAWTRTDVSPLTSSSRAGAAVAYAVVADGDAGQALLTFDPADGHTLDRQPLPRATGFPVGVSVGADARVVTGTSDGQVYAFAPVR